MAALVIGGTIGLLLARRVQMTADAGTGRHSAQPRRPGGRCVGFANFMDPDGALTSAWS